MALRFARRTVSLRWPIAVPGRTKVCVPLAQNDRVIGCARGLPCQATSLERGHWKRIGMASLRWGILGTGRIAPRLVRRGPASPRGRVTAVASRDEGRARAFAASHGIPRAFGSYAELVASPDVDVVYIALPNHLHAEWTVRALDAGKHVLCEKPLARSVAEVDAITEAPPFGPGGPWRHSCTSTTRRSLRALELARERGARTARTRCGSFTFFLTYPGRSADRSGQGGRLALGRRLLPGQPRSADRR